MSGLSPQTDIVKRLWMTFDNGGITGYKGQSQTPITGRGAKCLYHLATGPLKLVAFPLHCDL